MQSDVFITGEPSLIPFEIRYEGRSAADHVMPISALAESLDGFGRIYSVVGHFVCTGEYAKQLQALNATAYAREPQAKCYSMLGMVDWSSSTGIFSGFAGAVLSAVIAVIYNRASGNAKEMKHLRELFEKQLGFSQDVSQRLLDTVDRLSGALQTSAKKSASPIGGSCDRIDLYADGKLHESLDISHRDALFAEEAEPIAPERQYTILISEMDRVNRTCKASFASGDTEESQDEDGSPRRISCSITDPAASQEGNPYILAFASGRPLQVKAKAIIRAGLIAKLYISDSVS